MLLALAACNKSENPYAKNDVALIVGHTIIKTSVVAPDRVTAKTYTVTITRAASSDADLSAVILSSGNLSPAFSAGTIIYSASVPNDVATITVTPAADSPDATIKVNGTTVASGAATTAIPLATGQNVISVAVTAQD